jgi:hypothetical protein
MAIGKDRTADRFLRLTAYAVSAAIGCGALAMASQAGAQSLGATAAAATDSFDPNTTPLDGTTTDGSATATNGQAKTVNGRKAAAQTTESDDTPLNPRIRFTAPDPLATGSILDDDIGRVNTRDSGINTSRARSKVADDTQQGIDIGTFTLRPSVNQSFNYGSNKSGGTSSEDRTFLQTDIKSTLTSNWSRNQLIITGNGTLQRNISGFGQEQPGINIGADLRLDISELTTAHITAGYQFSREDADDPNAVAGAAKQAGVNQFNLGASVEHDFGLLRGTTELALSRSIYSDVTLTDGTNASLSDRNETAGTWRGRIGYELSPALIPFIEADLGRAIYDETRDSAGYARSSKSYGGKAGVQVDLGEKLKGELGIGYQHTGFDDARLSGIDSPTIDTSIAWSPQRGTDVGLGFSTTVQPSTTPGESGYVAYQLTGTLAHELRDDLTAKLTGGTTWRDYPGGSTSVDQTVYDAALGFTWGINRYLDMTSNVGYELTTQKTGDDSRQLRAGLGLTVKR